jgi:hypothetical protein
LELTEPLLPLWLKLAYSLFVAITLPIYWLKYGPRNFLWFSDIALFATAAALWLENALLASMMALAILIPEVVWNLSFFGALLLGRPVAGLADYMFDRNKPRYLRALSLFHVFLPLLLLWLVWRLGYDPDALMAQTVLSCLLLPLTYRLTDPETNINWVYGPFGRPQRRLPPGVYLVLVMLFFPLMIYLPTHLFLNWLMG